MPPSMVTLSIAATRIHRGLIDYASGHFEQYDITASYSSQRLLLIVVDTVG